MVYLQTNKINIREGVPTKVYKSGVNTINNPWDYGAFTGHPRHNNG
jgi:hypothetical protein